MFGMNYNIRVLCSHKDLFKCKSVEDCIALIPDDIEFKDMASQFCEISNLSDVQTTNSSILSSLDGVKRTLDFDKREEEELYWETSSNDSNDSDFTAQNYGEGHNIGLEHTFSPLLNLTNEKDEVPEEQTNKPSPTIKSTETVHMATPTNKTYTTKSKNVQSPGVLEAWTSIKSNFITEPSTTLSNALTTSKGKPKVLQGITFDRKEYNFFYPTLICSKCCFKGRFIITVGDPSYIKDYKVTNCWYDSDFIYSAAQLFAHKAHKDDTELVFCSTAQQVLTDHECHALSKDTNFVMSIWHDNLHYVCVELNLKKRYYNFWWSK